jgi:hypothetical protein
MLKLGQARDPSRIQIQPNWAKPAQRQSKKTGRFSWDSLVRMEPFQGLARTPWPRNIVRLLSPRSEALRCNGICAGARSRCDAPRYRIVRCDSGHSSPPIIAMFSSSGKSIFRNGRNILPMRINSTALIALAVGPAIADCVSEPHSSWPSSDSIQGLSRRSTPPRGKTSRASARPVFGLCC